jgi:putative transposase
LYVVRNPVKAGLCRTAGEWPYSSYRATVGSAPAPQWLAVDEIHAFFGSTRAEAQTEFARLVQERHLPVSDTEEATLE